MRISQSLFYLKSNSLRGFFFFKSNNLILSQMQMMMAGFTILKNSK